jgi:guanine nucleotide-binding protein G(i) subunit alpha
MAEALAVIGAAGAVANIIDVAGKTIKSLHDLHNRWRDADFTLLNLIAQLTALRAALSMIQEWIDGTEEPSLVRSHRLLMLMQCGTPSI